MIANFEYGDFDITLCKKYKIVDYKDSILHSGIHGKWIFVEESTDDLEEALDFRTERKEFKVKAGTKIGIFNFADEYDEDLAYGGYRLDGEVIFLNENTVYHDGNDDCSGEVSEWVVMLNDNQFISNAGEYSIINELNSADELSKFNQAINKKFDIIILSNS